jgi:ribonuclease R
VTKRKQSSAKKCPVDPYYQREAKKYAHPIPSREYILETLNQQARPMDFGLLAKTLRLKKNDFAALKKRLNAMVRDGQLICNRYSAYCVVNETDLMAGRVISHVKGFGFLRPDSGQEDIYLSPQEMHRLFHNDRVVVCIVGCDEVGRLEGGVVEILERNTRSLVGQLYIENDIGCVIPDNKRFCNDIIIPHIEAYRAYHAKTVVVEITEQPTRHRRPIGRILQVFDDVSTLDTQTSIVTLTYNLATTWSDAVVAECQSFDRSLSEQMLTDRVDLRSLPLLTIDGLDARDFDDAVYCKPTAKGWKVLVCIADVSAYVKPDTALDCEAFERGNSVYFPDRVLPMLPEILSNELCSLQPHVDRLCLACEFYVNSQGRIIRSRFFEAVMHSHARLTYDEVEALLFAPTPALTEQYAPLLPALHHLHDVFKVLLQARQARGALDLDTQETYFKFDDHGYIDTIVPLQRHTAHRIIEECMLAANVAAARLLERYKIPALFRIHEPPNHKKIQQLQSFLNSLAVSLPGGDQPTTQDYAQFIHTIAEREDRHLIQTVLLRSLQQAIYSCDRKGHFGLAYPLYTHFTSPIRRYPDLIVHRLIKYVLAGKQPIDFDYSRIVLQQIAEHCSHTERRADEATRDLADWLKCQYMQTKIGQQFMGLVVSVQSFGLFVQIDDIMIDGLVHITTLANEFYHFDPLKQRLTGEQSGRTYRLGDRLQIEVVRVNLEERKIDFMLVQSAPVGNKKRRRKQRKA